MRVPVSAVVLFTMAGVAACAGQSCSCMEPIPGGFPVAERRSRPIQIRATPELFRFVEDQAPTLVPQILPTGSTFNIPPSCGGSQKICCGNPAPMCRLDIGVQQLSIVPTAPNKLVLDMDVTLKTLDNLPVEVTSGVTCYISIDTKGRGTRQTMNLKGDVVFTVNATTNATEIALTNTSIDLENADVKFNEPGSNSLCTLGGGSISGVAVAILEGALADQLPKLVGDQACMKCSTKNDCNAFATQCMGGKCAFADGKCVQELGVSGRLDVGKMLSSFAPGLKAKLDVLAVLGDYAQADDGLALGMVGGGASPEHSACVPMVPAPPKATVPLSRTLGAVDVTPDGKPYHLGIGVHRSHFDTLGWAAWDGGALCLRVGTPTVALLSSQTLSIVIPSLGDLTHDADVPVFLVVRPQKPPTFRLGKGTFKTGAGGKREIDDPLLGVKLDQLALDFYVFVEAQYIRAMTITADVDLPVGLEIDADGKIAPVLGDLTSAFRRVQVTNSQLLAEAPSDLAQVFPMLLGLAGGQLGNAIAPIALPEVMGLRIAPKGITTIDPDANGANQFLAIYADLLPPAAMFVRPVETEARVAAVRLPPTSVFAVTGRTAVPDGAPAEPEIELAFDEGVDGLEHAVNVDDTGWSPFTPASRLTVTHPVLWIQGRHTIDVRARRIGDPTSVDRTPVRLEVLVDTEAPEGKLVYDALRGVVRAEAHDRVSRDATLRYRFLLDGKPLGDLSSLNEVELPVSAGIEAVTAEVVDEAGLTGTLRFHGRTTDPPASGGCGCAVGGAPATGGGPALVVALVAIGLLAARRRDALALLVVAAAALGACNNALGKGDFADPTDEIGRWLDAVAKDGTLHLSAYDSTRGDLVYAKISRPDELPSWQVVDGIDLSTEVDDPGGYRSGRTAPGPDVGMYSSIALTRSGEPRIAYYDASARAVKLALGPGRFSSHTVEAAPESDENVNLGLYTALSLDGSDFPSIAYMVTGLPDAAAGPNRWKSELRLARAKSARPSGPSDWTITVVDSTALSCAGRCPAGQACIMDAMVGGMPNGDPARSSCVAANPSACTPACADTEACVAGTCTKFLAPGKPDLPDGTGLFTQARRPPTGGGLVLVYHDRMQGDLKMASEQAAGGALAVSILDGGMTSTDVGQHASAAFGSDGTLHVAYSDAIGDRLLYRSVSGGTPGMVEVVDDGVREDGVHPVGAAASLLVDANGPRVVYQDQREADLWQAQRTGGGWDRRAVSADLGGHGFYARLVSDGKTTWLAQFVYDRQNGGPPLGRVEIRAIP
jgi:MYXO-CTERM domain-containing protein